MPGIRRNPLPQPAPVQEPRPEKRAAIIPDVEPARPAAEIDPAMRVPSPTVNPLVSAIAGASGGEFTAEEYTQAQLRAYWHALERGGGTLPPYDPGRALDDFHRAVSEVMAGRVGGS